jgi:hypothetical protein
LEPLDKHLKHFSILDHQIYGYLQQSVKVLHADQRLNLTLLKALHMLKTEKNFKSIMDLDLFKGTGPMILLIGLEQK